MRIGIDFDNTIAGYYELFREVALSEQLIDKHNNALSKTELRNCLLSQLDGEKKWMKLQGLVYGKYMQQAVLMHGVVNFLINCKYSWFYYGVFSSNFQDKFVN